MSKLQIEHTHLASAMVFHGAHRYRGVDGLMMSTCTYLRLPADSRCDVCTGMYVLCPRMYVMYVCMHVCARVSRADESRSWSVRVPGHAVGKCCSIPFFPMLDWLLCLTVCWAVEQMYRLRSLDYDCMHHVIDYRYTYR